MRIFETNVLIFNFLFYSTCFEPEGSSSGRRLYIHLWYGTFYMLGPRCTVVKVLRYKSEGRWFDPIWCHWNFSLT